LGKHGWHLIIERLYVPFIDLYNRCFSHSIEKLQSLANFYFETFPCYDLQKYYIVVDPVSEGKHLRKY